MIEAYLAAIFVDSDFDYSVIEAFYKRHIGPYFVDMSLYDTFANRHPTVSTTFLSKSELHTQLMINRRFSSPALQMSLDARNTA